MSRSYKKHPIITDGSPGHTKDMKRIANSKIRQNMDKLKGKDYKKYFCSYDIHDYICRYSWEKAKEDYENSPEDSYLKEKYPTLKDYYNDWCKYYKRK